MSENSTLSSKRTTVRTPGVRSRIADIQPRNAASAARTIRVQSRANLFSESSTAGSGIAARSNGLPLVSNRNKSTNPVGKATSTTGRAHLSTTPLRTTEATRARTSTVASVGIGGRARPKLVGRGGKSASTTTTTTNSLLEVRAAGVSSFALHKDQPRRSARLKAPLSPTVEKQTAEKASNTSPLVKRQSSVGRSSPGENAFYCPICLDNIKCTGGQIVVLPCGHAFCRDCLLASFQKKKHCPLCQVAFNDPKNIMEIFL